MLKIVSLVAICTSVLLAKSDEEHEKLSYEAEMGLFRTEYEIGLERARQKRLATERRLAAQSSQASNMFKSMDLKFDMNPGQEFDLRQIDIGDFNRKCKRHPSGAKKDFERFCSGHLGNRWEDAYAFMEDIYTKGQLSFTATDTKRYVTAFGALLAAKVRIAFGYPVAAAEGELEPGEDVCPNHVIIDILHKLGLSKLEAQFRDVFGMEVDWIVSLDGKNEVNLGELNDERLHEFLSKKCYKGAAAAVADGYRKCLSGYDIEVISKCFANRNGQYDLVKCVKMHRNSFGLLLATYYGYRNQFKKKNDIEDGSVMIVSPMSFVSKNNILKNYGPITEGHIYKFLDSVGLSNVHEFFKKRFGQLDYYDYY